MATGNSNKVEIEVSAIVNGEPGIDKLGKTLETTGAAAKKLGTDASASAAGIDKADAAAKGYTATSGKLRDDMDSVSTQLSMLTKAWGVYVGAVQFAGMIKGAADTADAYANLQARIKLVTGEGAGFVTAFEGITDVAKRTSSSLESTGNLFTKIAAAGKEMGVGQAQALALTETINKSILLSGASAQASDAAIVQLIQGLQSGVLRGEEFNSVMEQAPRLASALAAGLGVTTGELRKLAEEGKLTSDVVIKSLTSQSEVVAKEFEKLPPTVGRALQNLSSAWTLYVGETDKASGASVAASKSIGALSDNLKTVAELLFDAGKAALAYTAYKLADNFISTSAAASKAAAATAASTAAIEASTAAAAKNSAALAANTIERDAMGVAITRTTAALTGNAAAMTAMGAGLAATSTRYGENKTQLAALGTELAATTGKTAAATAEVGLLGKTFGTIGAIGASAFGIAGQAVKGFAALLGGIPGIALMILVNVKDIGTWMGEFVAKHTAWGSQLEKNEAKLAAIAAKEKQAIDDKIKAQAELNAANDKAVEVEKKRVTEAEKYIPIVEKETKTIEAQAKAAIELAKVGGDAIALRKVEIDQGVIVAAALEKDATARAALVAARQAEIAAIQAQGESVGGLTAMQTKQIAELEKLLAAETQEADKSAAIAATAKIEAAARAVLSDAYKDNSTRVGQYGQALDNAKAKLEILEKSGVASLKAIKDAQLEVNVASAKHKDALSDTIGALQSNIKLESDHAKATLEAALASGKLSTAQRIEIEAALANAQATKDNSSGLFEYKGAVAAATAEVERLVKAHAQGKASDDELAIARGRLTNATKLYKDSVKDTEAAYKQLGITSPAELKKIADANSAAWDKIKNDSSLTLAQLKTAFETYAKSAIAASGDVGSEQRRTTEELLKQDAALKGLTVTFDAEGKMVVQTQAEAAAAIAKTTDKLHGQKDAVDAVTAAREKENAVRERAIAAQEKENDLKQRAIDLENKRLNIDREGYSVDPKTGERVVMGGETKRSVYEKAKGGGLSEEQALQIAARFIGENGQKVGWQDADASRGENWYTLLQKAIDEMVLQNAQEKARQDKAAESKDRQANTANTDQPRQLPGDQFNQDQPTDWEPTPPTPRTKTRLGSQSLSNKITPASSGAYLQSEQDQTAPDAARAKAEKANQDRIDAAQAARDAADKANQDARSASDAAWAVGAKLTQDNQGRIDAARAKAEKDNQDRIEAADAARAANEKENQDRRAAQDADRAAFDKAAAERSTAADKEHQDRLTASHEAWVASVAERAKAEQENQDRITADEKALQEQASIEAAANRATQARLSAERDAADNAARHAAWADANPQQDEQAAYQAKLTSQADAFALMQAQDAAWAAKKDGPGNTAKDAQNSIQDELDQLAGNLAAIEKRRLEAKLEKAKKDGDKAAQSSTQDELDQLAGKYYDIEKRHFEARKLELEAKRDEAKGSGDKTAASGFDDALQKLDQLYKIKLVDALNREQDKADADKAADKAAREPKYYKTAAERTAAEAAPARTVAESVSKTINVRITMPDGTTPTVPTNEGGADVLIGIIRQLTNARLSAGV